MAYGAQGIAHFRYDTGLWKDPATPLPLYWSVSRLNRDFPAIASELQPLTSPSAYHCGHVPQGGQALPPGSRFVPEPPFQELLLGYFGKSARRATHVLVVNLDYRKTASATLAGPGPMQQFHAPTRAWSAPSKNPRLTLDLPPGGRVLLRLRR